jgi:hypothetical protein
LSWCSNGYLSVCPPWVYFTLVCSTPSITLSYTFTSCPPFFNSFQYSSLYPLPSHLMAREFFPSFHWINCRVIQKRKITLVIVKTNGNVYIPIYDSWNWGHTDGQPKLQTLAEERLLPETVWLPPNPTSISFSDRHEAIFLLDPVSVFLPSMFSNFEIQPFPSILKPILLLSFPVFYTGSLFLDLHGFATFAFFWIFTLVLSLTAACQILLFLISNSQTNQLTFFYYKFFIRIYLLYSGGICSDNSDWTCILFTLPTFLPLQSVNLDPSLWYSWTSS